MSGVVVRKGESGPAVEDVQQRLALIGCMDKASVDGVFGDETADAVRRFCVKSHLDETGEVTEKVWAALIDASFAMGDRTLYLRMPYFHGHDVMQLQRALGALGFNCNGIDGIFGAGTEQALRKFQMNMGLPTDGIAGAYTYAALGRLQFSWENKEVVNQDAHLGFARAANALEKKPICLFGTRPFTRDVASRMYNLALATNPMSKVVSADSLSVTPSADTLRVHVVLPEESNAGLPRVVYGENTLATRLRAALDGLSGDARIVEMEVPGETWEDAGLERSAQHFAITLLDALCTALSER